MKQFFFFEWMTTIQCILYEWMNEYSAFIMNEWLQYILLNEYIF